MANTQYIDNQLNFKFVWLNSGELVHLQSRGLSLEVCGYLPISLGNKPNYLREMINATDEDEKSKILNIGNELVDYRLTDGNSSLDETGPMVFIFPGMTYQSNGKYLLKNTTPEYKSNLVNFQDHLFKDIRALSTTEMKFVAQDVDSKFDTQNQTAAEGSIQLSFDIKNETFGTTIQNSFYIDAVMIFGQAYNDRADVDLTREQRLQKIVPLGLILYADDREVAGEADKKQRPFIQPGKMNGVVVRETLVISLLQGGFKINAIQDDENYKKWKDFAGRLHLVNDNLSTSAKFCMTDNTIRTKNIEEVKTDYIDKLSANGQTFAFHDRLYMADFPQNLNDQNDDFGAPALLTCMTSGMPGAKNPQVMMGQIATKGDGTGNSWDGVAHTYWTESISKPDKSHSGCLYNVDWIGYKRPGINIFCQSLNHVYTDEYRTSNRDESACFGGGFQVMSTDSFASRYASNFLGYQNDLRGNAVAIGSQNIKYYQSGFNAQEVRDDRKTNNGSTGSMFINSEYMNITSTGGGTDYLTTVAADNIWLYGTGNNVNKKRRVTIVNGEQQQIIDSNRVLMLNVKGTKTGAVGDWNLGGVTRTTNSIIANGFNRINSVDKGVIIGDNNYMGGASVDRISTNCQIFGSDNRIDSVNTKYGQALKITQIGHGLRNDPKQQIFERTQSPCKTIILGQDNNVYTQLDTIASMTLKTSAGKKGAKGSKGLKGVAANLTRGFSWTDYTNTNIYPVAIKQVVIGGWKPASVKHKVQKYNMAEFAVDNGTLNDSIMTLMDIKGRAVDYTSRGVNVAVQDTHSQDAYDHYDYRSLGGINWAKLIQLLNRLEYDPTTNIVKYNAGNKGVNDPNNLSKYYDTLNGSRKLYDLVRNDVGVGPLPSNF